MDSEDKKKYKLQYLIYRIKNNEELACIDKEVLLFRDQNNKYFSKNDTVDNYIFVMQDEKIVSFLKQKTNSQSIKYLVGYDIKLSPELKKNDFFCEFEQIISQLSLSKSKLPSEYKSIFQSSDKKIEKI